MDVENTDAKYINYKLMKMLGFYQILNPRETYKVWGYNVYQLLYAFPVLVELIFIVFGLIGLYYWSNDLNHCAQLLSFASACYMTMYKAIRFAQKHRELKECYRVMKEDFLPYTNYSKNIYESYKRKCIKVTYICALSWLCVWLNWLLSPLLIKEYPVKNLAGETLTYRNNILNLLYSPMSEAHYHNLYALIYTLEAIVITHIIVFYVVDEMIMITFCWMISAQLETVASVYSSFGYNSSLPSNIGGNQLTEIEKLATIISNHQRIIEVLCSFYDIIRPLIITQIGFGSANFTIFTYMFVWNWFNDSFMLSLESARWMLAALILMAYLYISCYFFGYLDDQVKSINFALYSSNWTEKDIRFQKLVLLAMNMNSAMNSISMKITPTKLVNLEMFASVMHVSYSIVSVLAKKKLSDGN